jgi:proteic killer suppression protein
MIKTFRHQGLRRLFESAESTPVAAELSLRLTRQLDFLNRAVSPADMNLPGYGLNELKGERQGMWGVMVGGNWRLTFSFQDTDACDVDLENYQ